MLASVQRLRAVILASRIFKSSRASRVLIACLDATRVRFRPGGNFLGSVYDQAQYSHLCLLAELWGLVIWPSFLIWSLSLLMVLFLSLDVRLDGLARLVLYFLAVRRVLLDLVVDASRAPEGVRLRGGPDCGGLSFWWWSNRFQLPSVRALLMDVRLWCLHCGVLTIFAHFT